MVFRVAHSTRPDKYPEVTPGRCQVMVQRFNPEFTSQANSNRAPLWNHLLGCSMSWHEPPTYIVKNSIFFSCVCIYVCLSEIIKPLCVSSWMPTEIAITRTTTMKCQPTPPVRAVCVRQASSLLWRRGRREGWDPEMEVKGGQGQVGSVAHWSPSCGC